jgi:carbon-monoxide dehydrogenase iron sulfur subunit
MKAVYVKENVCIGCHLCEVYCQIHHSQSKDPIKAFKNERPRPLPRVIVEEGGPVSFSVRCQHCEEAPCVYSCITGALYRDDGSGIVRLDEEKCIGCWTCVLVCPLGAIRRDKNQTKTIKCDLCEGEDIPVCVANCPNEALLYIDVQEQVAVGSAGS